MSTYQPLVYKEQGGKVLVVRAKDGGSFKGQSTASGTPAQASHVADATTSYAFASGADFTSTIAGTIETAVNSNATKINSILTALENIGVLATS